MKNMSSAQLDKLLKSKGINPRVSWIYSQFIDIFEQEYFIQNISLSKAIKNLIQFLNKNKIKEVLFFQEPGFDFGVSPGIIQVKELAEFLRKNASQLTNTHIADINLKWIFTIDFKAKFAISGEKKLVEDFIGFFKNAECVSFEEMAVRWIEEAKESLE